jgi:methylmalonyl-CoA/ethylmalonyl-CoA epimerase
VIYFWVDDIDEAHRALVDRGVAFEHEPHLIHKRDDGSEEWMGFFRDPDRNLLAIASERQRSDAPGGAGRSRAAPATPF